MILEDTNEIWKDIDGLEGEYAVSSKGRVKNIKNGKILNGSYNNDGYKHIKLKGKPYTIHKLVALAFIPNPQNLPQINHLDERKDNNHVSNLTWCTASENTRHSCHKYSCKINQLTLDGELVKVWESSMHIERETGYNHGNILKCCKGKRRSAYNFRWEYLDSSFQRIVNHQVIAYKGTEFIGVFANARKASKALGLKWSSVSHCLRGRLKSNKGYTFKYAE